MKTLGYLVTLLAAGLAAGQAQINYTGGTYSENFDGLPNTGNTTLAGTGTVGVQAAVPGVSGWQAARVGGTATTAININADIGTGTGGRFYSYGAASSSERALGSVGSGTTWGGFGASLLNASSDTYDSITISFYHEIWSRQGTTQAAPAAWDDILAFAYGFSSTPGITAANYITSAAMTPLAALNATSPSSIEWNSVTDGSTPPRNVDGNSATYRQLVTATISGLNWAPGDTFFMRWQDSDTGGFDSGHGIDDLALTTTVIPEPSSGLLLGAAFLVGLAGRRFRRERVS